MTRFNTRIKPRLRRRKFRNMISSSNYVHMFYRMRKYLSGLYEQPNMKSTRTSKFLLKFFRGEHIGKLVSHAKTVYGEHSVELKGETASVRRLLCRLSLLSRDNTKAHLRNIDTDLSEIMETQMNTYERKMLVAQEKVGGTIHSSVDAWGDFHSDLQVNCNEYIPKGVACLIFLL